MRLLIPAKFLVFSIFSRTRYINCRIGKCYDCYVLNYSVSNCGVCITNGIHIPFSARLPSPS
ncbi:hypothetical protein X975_08744, partial [Stegodyphus mimosarum]